MAVYCLMFKDAGLRKLTPSNMEIETYTNDVMKIIGMCHFYMVHPESKQLKKVMFFVAKEMAVFYFPVGLPWNLD